MCRAHSNVIPFLIGKNLWLKCRVKSLEHPRLVCRTDDTFVHRTRRQTTSLHISPAPQRTHYTRALCTGTWRRILFGCNWISSIRCDVVLCDTLCIWQFGQCHRHMHTTRRTLIAPVTFRVLWGAKNGSQFICINYSPSSTRSKSVWHIFNELRRIDMPQHANTLNFAKAN